VKIFSTIGGREGEERERGGRRGDVATVPNSRREYIQQQKNVCRK
jgi:hypothetical protein